MSWAAAIPAIIGLGLELFGEGQGEQLSYSAMMPEWAQQAGKGYSSEIMRLVEGAGKPYGGPLAAQAMNPFSQSAFGLWGSSPYAAMGMGEQFLNPPAPATYQDYPGIQQPSPPPVIPVPVGGGR